MSPDLSHLAVDSIGRERRAQRTTWTLALSRVVSLACALVSVRLSISHLGPEKYGAWVTLTALVAIVGLGDLGIARGIQNFFGRAMANRNSEEAASVVSTGFGALVLAGAALVAIFGTVALVLPWSTVLNVQRAPGVDAELRWSALVLVLCVGGLVPLGLAQALRASLQSGHVNAVWAGSASLFSLAMLASSVALDLGLTALVASVGLGPVVAAALNSWSFFRSTPALIPRRAAASRRLAWRLIRTGSLFFVLQASALLAFQTDTIVIARLLGGTSVPAYSIPAQMVAAGTALLSFIAMPLWPAYTDAIAKGDVRWVSRTFVRSLKVNIVISSLGGLTLVLLGRPVARLMSGGEIEPTFTLLVAFAGLLVVSGVGSATAALLNGAHELRVQAACGGAMAVANVLLTIVLVRGYGVAGAVVATVASYTALVVLPYLYVIPRFLRRLDRGSYEVSGLVA